MSNFKVGDKVVYIGGCTNPDIVLPNTDTEICTVAEIVEHWGHLHAVLSEYPVDISGVKQGFHYSHIRKVEPSKQKTSYRLANLEILTQFPTIRETSDQPIRKEQEVEHA